MLQSCPKKPVPVQLHSKDVADRSLQPPPLWQGLDKQGGMFAQFAPIHPGGQLQLKSSSAPPEQVPPFWQVKLAQAWQVLLPG